MAIPPLAPHFWHGAAQFGLNHVLDLLVYGEKNILVLILFVRGRHPDGNLPSQGIPVHAPDNAPFH